MRTKRFKFAAVLLAASLCGWSGGESTAFAQKEGLSAKSKAQAAELKKQGDDAMKGLKYEEAVAAYTKAYEINEDPAMLYNRGRALQGLGRFPEALQEFESFKEKASPALRARVPALDGLISEVRSKITTVTFKSNVDGARVIVRDKVIGTIPMSHAVKLNAGSAVVQVEADGFNTFEKKIDFKGGESMDIDAQLVAKTNIGLLIIRSPVGGAKVSLNGKPVGNVPVEKKLPGGTHRIVVERDGYVSAETTAVVVAGQRKVVNIALEPVKPVYKQWWFWTGIGVAIAGGVAISIAATTEAPPGNGDLTPGKISAPFRF